MNLKNYKYLIQFILEVTVNYNCIMFGVDMSSSVHVNNKKKDILILAEDPTKRLDGTTLTLEKNNQLILMKILFELAL